MKKLRKVGFYKELDHGDSDGDSLKEAINKLCLEKLESILLYLHSAKLFIASPGLVEDVLDGGNIIGPLSIYTDGEWSWPSDLAYYVKKYKVGLPNDFVEHMEAVGWRVAEFNIEEVEL